MNRQGKLAAVLFDLDGTLVDTAPDMVHALCELQRFEGIPVVDYELARSWVSHGAPGLIRLGFPDADPDRHEQLRLAFLDRYAEAVCRHSRLFPGLAALLDSLDRLNIPWGIVTNKPARFTAPLLESLGIASRAAATVSGDTIAQRKPDPAPLLLATQHAAVDPGTTVYIGDAERDIVAGRRAGMGTVAAAYGYIPTEENPYAWGADHVAENPDELAHWVMERVNLGI